jgi:hypothetical protein
MIPKVIISLILSFVLLSCGRGEREIIIAPRNYTGYILVIFNQENGQPIKYLGKKRVYEIPRDGVLKTQFNINGGWSDYPEFFYEEVNKENRIPSSILSEIDNLPLDTIVGFFGATGSIIINDHGEERIRFAKYYIGTRFDIKRAEEEADKLDILKLK